MAQAATTSPARRTRAAGGPCPAGLPCLSSRAVGSARAASRLGLAARRQGRQDGGRTPRCTPGFLSTRTIWARCAPAVPAGAGAGEPTVAWSEGPGGIRSRPGLRTGGPHLPVTERCGLQRERWSDATARGAAARPTPGEGHLRLRSGVPAHQGRSPARGHLSCLLLRRRASCRRAPPWARSRFFLAAGLWATLPATPRERPVREMHPRGPRRVPGPARSPASASVWPISISNGRWREYAPSVLRGRPRPRLRVDGRRSTAEVRLTGNRGGHPVPRPLRPGPGHGIPASGR